MKLKRPNIELILRYIQDDVSAQERLYVTQMIQLESAWKESYDTHKQMAQVVSQMPTLEPPSRVWAAIKSEIQNTSVKPVWQVYIEDFFRPYQVAWASACTVIIAGLWYGQVLMQPEFQFVDVTDVNGFSLEADTYIANHEVLYSEPVTQEILLAFYPVETNSSFENE